jgi:hypothetical protein
VDFQNGGGADEARINVAGYGSNVRRSLAAFSSRRGQGKG